ncbi:GIY-YIG nuclease family protein [Actinosynnema sp. NPDC023794]
MNPVDPALLHTFAADLKAWHIALGEPSYTAISRTASRHGESLSPASINNLLTGKRLTSSAIALAFVRNVLRHVGNHDEAVHQSEVGRWLKRWTEVRNSTNPALITIAPDVDRADSPMANHSNTDTPPAPGGTSPAPPEQPIAPKETRRPPASELLPPNLRIFRAMVDEAMRARDPQERQWADARWGCYAFYDFDGEPIYVGQTNERLRTRVRRHLTNQRTDAVAMRIFDVMEVAEVELWPLWELEHAGVSDLAARERIDRVEYTIYRNALEQSPIGLLLNEKIPRQSEPVDLPPSARFPLVDATIRQTQGAPDIRIARSAETLSRLSSVAAERGIVSTGLRRVMVVQAARLTRLTASRHAYAAGLHQPPPNLVDLRYLRAPDPD